MSVHRALRVTGLATGINFVLAMGSSIIVARLLSPREIGIYSIAVTLVSLGHMLRDFGVGQYLVKLKEVTRQDLRAAFSIMLFTSWTVAGLMVALSPVAARFYGQPGVGRVFYVLAANFALLPFGAYILSMLKREMDFNAVAKINIASGIASTIVTLGSAWHGASYMSMAWGSLAGVVTTIIGLAAARPALALLPPTLRGLGPVLKFGGTASLANLISRMDDGGADLVLGKTMSVEAVAHFSRANSLLTMICGKVNEVLLQVFAPAFAKGLREGQAPAPLLARAIESHTGLQIPLVLMLALVAKPMILLLFGSQWQEAADIAPWVTLWAVLAAPIQLAYSALAAGGHASAVLRASAISSTTLLTVLLSSLVLDLRQLAFALLLFRIGALWTWQAQLRHHYGFDWRWLWQACRRSLLLGLLTAVPAALAAVALAALWPDAPPFWHIVLVGGVGSLAYVAMMRRGRHPLRDELLRMAPPLHWLLGRPAR
ncbi:MAG: oligosaccharide flippase family protein [Roseateles sp.]|uniref:oligosaccharide flippase family protein n=1 Tax=Roseateles sp. TaxID=1971397 RepID=UPI0039E8B706